MKPASPQELELEDMMRATRRSVSFGWSCALALALVGARGNAQAPTPSGAIVRGRVLQNGAPLAGCPVEAWSDWGMRDPVQRARCVADDAGRFAVEGLEPRVVTLVFLGDTVPQPWVKRDVRVPAAGVVGAVELGDVEIPIGGSIRGRVVDESGQPVAHLLVFRAYATELGREAHFDRATLDPAAAKQQSVRTDADGRFAFAHLPPGTYSLLLEPEARVNLREYGKDVELAPDATIDVGAIVLKPGIEVSGHVFDPQGSAIAGARVSPLTAVDETVARRRGVLTAGDGGFVLAGVETWESIAIEAEGYEMQVRPLIDLRGVARGQPVPDLTRVPELVVELRPALELRGIITGQGDAATNLEIESDFGAHGPLPKHFWPLLWGPHPVAADGSFCIRGLPAGDYTLRAHAKAVGDSAQIRVTLPRHDDAPLAIAIVPEGAIAVTVVDDRGQPVVGARVVRNTSFEKMDERYRGRDSTARILQTLWSSPGGAISDDQGVARVPAPASGPLALVAMHDAYLSTAKLVEADESREAITLVMGGAGRVRGKLDDASGSRHYRLRIECRPLGLDDKVAEAKTVKCDVDAAGRFASGPLAPGRYRIAVLRENTSEDPGRGAPAAVPLLGSGVDLRGALEVDVTRGEITDCAVHAAPTGTISGTVVQAGAPVAGAIVFAAKEGYEFVRLNRALPATTWDDEGVERYVPHTTTDGDGRFTFAYVAPGAWDFRVRAADGPLPTLPVRVVATDYGQKIAQDLALGSGGVVGQLDVAALPRDPQDTSRVFAYLFPLERASSDPFFLPYDGQEESASMRAVEIGSDGRFAFPAVREGTYVVRVAKRLLGQVLIQRVVHLAAETVDLGLLPPAATRATLRCADARVTGAWLRQPVVGSKRGVFVAAFPCVKGAFVLPPLEPGGYVIEPFAEPRRSAPMEVGYRGDSFGVEIPVRIAADGTAEPAEIELPADAQPRSK